MSIFYVLPPRPMLGQRFAAFLKTVFPGLDWPSACWSELAESLGAAACRPDVFVVYREELPFGEDLASALSHGFGAEVGDEIIEVDPENGVTQRWHLERAA